MKIEKWKKFEILLDEDGAEIKKQLMLAGLLLVIFEQFKKFIIQTIEGFFANNYELKEGKLLYNRGEEFKKIIKIDGKGEKGQHTNDAFRAALKWFLKFDAISNKEFDEIERLYSLRNSIGHELFNILLDDKKEFINENDISTVFNVYLKITRWWIKEVVATTDPECEKYSAENLDYAVSLETVFLSAIVNKALSDNKKESNF